MGSFPSLGDTLTGDLLCLPSAQIPLRSALHKRIICPSRTSGHYGRDLSGERAGLYLVNSRRHWTGGVHGNGHQERLALSRCRKTHSRLSRRSDQPQPESAAPVQGSKAIFTEEINLTEHLRTRRCCRRKGLCLSESSLSNMLTLEMR